MSEPPKKVYEELHYAIIYHGDVPIMLARNPRKIEPTRATHFCPECKRMTRLTGVFDMWTGYMWTGSFMCTEHTNIIYISKVAANACMGLTMLNPR